MLSRPSDETCSLPMSSPILVLQFLQLSSSRLNGFLYDQNIKFLFLLICIDSIVEYSSWLKSTIVPLLFYCFHVFASSHIKLWKPTSIIHIEVWGNAFWWKLYHVRCSLSTSWTSRDKFNFTWCNCMPLSLHCPLIFFETRNSKSKLCNYDYHNNFEALKLQWTLNLKHWLCRGICHLLNNIYIWQPEKMSCEVM